MAGRKPNRSLFKVVPGEEDKPTPDAPYDLNDFKTHFLAVRDSTGYTTAQDLLVHVDKLQRWDEWTRIFKQGPLQRVLENWKAELQVIILSEAEKAISSGCDPKDFPRLKFIAEGKLHPKRGVGRPSKNEPAKKEIVQEQAQKVVAPNMDNVIQLGKRNA